MIALRVLRGGLLTTVQDLGRPRCRRWGIAPSGAADPFSARLANLRAGNREGDAVLEMTASGARFEALARVRVAFAGAEMPVLRNGSAIDPEFAVELVAGDLLEFGTSRRGFRTYLAVSGGVDVPEILGSRATHLSAGFGGWKGRKLEANDEIAAFRDGRASEPAVRPSFPLPRGTFEVRVVAGPQEESLPPDAVRRFFGAEFRVSPRSNRMGLRLEGGSADSPKGESPADAVPEMAPEGSIAGAIQIPPGGEPIVHMPEGPVTGGYPRIAAVISADLGVIGQLPPGGRVRFREVSIEEALRARREREMILEERRP